MVFVSHEVPFPATSDRRSRVAGNGTECEVKTIELSSPTSGGEKWAFLNLLIFIARIRTKIKKIIRADVRSCVSEEILNFAPYYTSLTPIIQALHQHLLPACMAPCNSNVTQCAVSQIFEAQWKIIYWRYLIAIWWDYTNAYMQLYTQIIRVI